MGVLNVKPIYDVESNILDFLNPEDKRSLITANRVYPRGQSNDELFKVHYKKIQQRVCSNRKIKITNINLDLPRVKIDYSFIDSPTNRSYMLNLKGLENYTLRTIDNCELDVPITITLPKINTPPLHHRPSQPKITYPYTLKALNIEEPEILTPSHERHRKKSILRVRRSTRNNDKTHSLDSDYLAVDPYFDSAWAYRYWDGDYYQYYPK